MEQKELNQNNQPHNKKEILSASVVKKNSRVDTEKILYDQLFPKFGKRFLDYRKKYEN